MRQVAVKVHHSRQQPVERGRKKERKEGSRVTVERDTEAKMSA